MGGKMLHCTIYVMAGVKLGLQVYTHTYRHMHIWQTIYTHAYITPVMYWHGAYIWGVNIHVMVYFTKEIHNSCCFYGWLLSVLLTLVLNSHL